MLLRGSHPTAFSDTWNFRSFPGEIQEQICYPPRNFHHYCEKISEMKALYKGRLEVLLGLEVDFIPGQTLAF